MSTFEISLRAAVRCSVKYDVITSRNFGTGDYSEYFHLHELLLKRLWTWIKQKMYQNCSKRQFLLIWRADVLGWSELTGTPHTFSLKRATFLKFSSVFYFRQFLPYTLNCKLRFWNKACRAARANTVLSSNRGHKISVPLCESVCCWVHR